MKDTLHNRIGILGAGAMGGLFGALITESGREPLLIEVNPETVSRINADGVRVRAGDGERSLPVKATDDPAGEPPVDLLIVFVKSYATEAAAQLAAPVIGQSTQVLTLQNGWGNGDRLARFVDPSRVFVGVTYHSATLESPGVVAHTAVGPTHLGPAGAGSLVDAEALAASLAGAGIEADVAPRVAEVIWRKLVLNASANPVAALTGLRSEGLIEHEEVSSLLEGIAREVVAVARAKGYNVEAEQEVAAARNALVNAGPATASMRQDVEAGRPTELDVITGAVLRAAEETNVDVPLNRAIHALISGYELSLERR